ncbi:hypothetical protein JKG47_10085 [Acidithiobacillus sp. MC6.1]|nr:hypothetical protein [Acidithiobacillus sp. MC6.1]
MRSGYRWRMRLSRPIRSVGESLNAAGLHEQRPPLARVAESVSTRADNL